MRITPPIEEEIKRIIREAIALDPLINITRMQKHLEEQFDRSFSFYYVRKLMHKVAAQSRMEADRTQIEQRMYFTRENYRMMRERLLEIVYWKPNPEIPIEKQRPPYNEDVIEAATKLVMLDLALLKAEIDCGMYKKPVEVIARELRYDPLPPEIRVVVMQSWRNFGMLPEAAIQAIVPAQENANAGATTT